MKIISIGLPLYSWVVDEIINDKLSEIEDSEEIMISLNSPGGSVFAGWQLIGALNSREGKVTVNIMGHAASMSVIFAAIFETNMLDVSKIMIHKAVGPTDTEEEVQLLNTVNRDLFAKLQVKVDDSKLKALKGVTLKEIFSSEKRSDYWFTAKEAKDIGLIKKVIKLESKEDIAAIYGDHEIINFGEYQKPTEIIKENSNLIINKIKNNLMDLAKLKAEHPVVYAQAVEIGQKAEKERVEAWMEFADVDAEAVKAGVESGKEISKKEIIALSRKGFESSLQEGLKANNKADTDTEDPSKVKTEEQKTVEAFSDEADKFLGIKK